MITTLPHHFVGFTFSSDLSLLTLKGCGLQYIDSHDYYWENRGRNQQLCLIQYCISGEGALEVNNLIYSILPGDAFIIQIPGESHYYLPEHSKEWEVLFLEFTNECLPFIQKIYRNIGPVIHLPEESSFPYRFLDIYEKALKNELKTVFENTKMAYSLWIDLIAYMLASSTANPTKIDYAKSYIDQNYYKEDLSLDTIAIYSGISKYYMCKEFRKKYGISPGKYLKDLRISQACRLLTMNTNYTMQDIAQMVGYANNNYFGKIFKVEKGISPEKFRRGSNRYDFVRTISELPKHYSPPDNQEH